MQEIRLTKGQDRSLVQLTASLTGEGISILLTGGDKPHVGAVVLSVPRTSLTGSGVSCDTWILPVPGHKDMEAAKPVAEQVCLCSGQATVVVAGLHVDNASAEEIKRLLQHCQDLSGELVRQLDSDKFPSNSGG